MGVGPESAIGIHDKTNRGLKKTSVLFLFGMYFWLSVSHLEGLL
jgi:hypothetical protein